MNHNGDINIAKELIDIAHDAGANYVKFQKRTIEDVYTREELDKPRESPWGTTTREQKMGLEFSFEDLKEIDAYCKDKIPWFASPWDSKSVFLLSQFDIPFIKIPSALIANLNLIRLVLAQTKKPIIISTGMSTPEMIEKAVGVIGFERLYCLMHCTSTYPTATDELNLRCITTFKEMFPWVRIGFSNHHPGIPFMVAAAAMGADMIEFHVTLDKTMYGSDQAASFNPDGIRKIIKYVRDVETAMGNGIKQIYDSELPIIKKLRK